MPADLMEKSSSSPAAATPGSAPATPERPRTASEHRKSSKPVMEKRRRARINHSLAQLKSLIVDALKKDSSRHSKLEKADILEISVRHLRNLQRFQMSAALNADPTMVGKYWSGFSECMNEVRRFLSTCEGVTTEVRTRLLGHLSGSLSQIHAVNCAPPAAPPYIQPGGANHPTCSPVPCTAVAESTRLQGAFQLVPSSEGHWAFLIPHTALEASNALLPLYPSRALAPGLQRDTASPRPRAPSPVSMDSVWRPW